jgi:hypothetical protein
MANKWLAHLSRFRKQNSHLDARSMMTEARKTYGGGAGAGASVTSYEATSGVAANAALLKGGNHSYSQNSSAASVGGRRSRRLRGGSCHMKNANPASFSGGRRKSRRRRCKSRSRR